MDIPPADGIPLPEGEEDLHESEHNSEYPNEDSTNFSQEDDPQNLPGPSPSDPPPSNPLVPPPNFLGPPPQLDIPNPPHSHGMFAAGGLPNLNLPPPSAPHFSAPPPIPHFSAPPPGFPPLNQPPPGMGHFAQPPPSILHQLKGPPPPPILKDTPFILKTSTNETVSASTNERYSPSRVTADDEEALAAEAIAAEAAVTGVEKGEAQDDDGSSEKALDKTSTTTLKKPLKNVLKGKTSLLGKAGAKKRLMAFSGKTSFNISKTSKVTAGSVLEENDEAEKSAAKKPVVPVVKKKKEEKKSMIEHIREEETRIKEAIGLKQFHMPFNLYGPGLFPISKLLDNPEELAKFEEKVKGMPDRLAAYEEKEKKRLEDTEKEKEDKRQRDKEKRKGRESGRSKDSETEKNKNNDKRNEDVEIKRKPKSIPKNWREFKNDNVTFEDIQKLFREYQENRSRDHRRQSFVDDIEAKLMVPMRVKSKNRGVMDKEFPAHMICSTNTKPRITFSINPQKYRAHYLTRYEMKQHKSLESWSLLKEFWNSYSNFTLVNEGESSREWYEASWSIDAICAKADLRDDVPKGKNPDETDVAIKSRWDSDNEAEESASQSEERLRKSSHAIKKQSNEKESIKHKNVKDGKFSEGLTEEYDLFLKSLDDEDEHSKEKTTKENDIEDDSKDDEMPSNDIGEKETEETIGKDQDSDVSVSVEPPNKELNTKKKKNKKLKKQKKEAKKKKKEEKKAKKKAKKAKKKLKEQKEKEMDSKIEEASNIGILENDKGIIKNSPRENTSHEDLQYNNSSSKYQEEEFDHSNDSRYVNSVGRSEDNPSRRGERPVYEEHHENDIKHLPTERNDYYENKYSSSKVDDRHRSYEKQFSKRDSNSHDYQLEEFDNRYSRQKFSDPKEEFREKQRRDSVGDSQKVFKEISNNIERCISENAYDVEYKESHHNRHDNKLRKDEMDYINSEKNNRNDLGRTMLYISDSENDEYDDSYDKSTSDRKERKRADKSYKNDDLQYSERYYDEKDSRSSNRLDSQDDRTNRQKTQVRKEKPPIAFKVSGAKYSGQHIKLPRGFSAEDEQDIASEVSNNDLEAEDNGKEDHVVGSLADTLRALRQIGAGKTDIKDIEKNKDKNVHDRSKNITSDYSYQSEKDSSKWRDKNHFQKSSGRSDITRHKESSPRAEEQYTYERSRRSRSPEEFKRYRSNSPRERSPRESSPRSSQIRARSPRRSQSPMRELSTAERSRYSEKHQKVYKSPDYEDHYEDRRSKYYEDRSNSSKYQHFEESHHHGNEKEFEKNYHESPEHRSYESYSLRNENYVSERERSPAYIDDRKRSRSRENLSAGYYSSEEFKHSRSNSSDRKELKYNSGYSSSTTEIENISDSKSSDRRSSSYFTKDFKEHKKYASEIEEYPNRRERKLYDKREESHDREYYRHEGDKNIDQQEIYRSSSDYRSSESTIDRRYRENDDEYNRSAKIERESSIHRNSDIEESSHFSKGHSNRKVKEKIEDRDEYYDHVASPIKKERFSSENRNQDRNSYNYHREDYRSAEVNAEVKSNSLDRNSKYRTFSPESGSRIRKNSYEYSASPNRYEYTKSHTSSTESGSIKSRSPLREDSSSQRNISPTHIRSTNKRSISPGLRSPPQKVQRSPRISELPSRDSRSPNRSFRTYSPTRSRSPSRRISPSQKERSPNYGHSPRRMSSSPQRRISKSQYQLSRSPQRKISRSPQNRLSVSPQRLRSPYRKSRSSKSPSKQHLEYHGRLSPHRLSPHRQFSRSPNRRVSRSPKRRLSKSPTRRLSRSPQRRLSRSPQRRLSRSPQGRLSRSPQRRMSRSPQRRLSPHRGLSSPSNRRKQYSQERDLSRSPLRRSKSPERKVTPPSLSGIAPLRIGELRSISSSNNITIEPSSINNLVDEGKHTSTNLTNIKTHDEYESKGTKEPSKIPLPDDHGNHGAQEHTKIPLPDNKERLSSTVNDSNEVPKPSSNESDWVWDKEKLCWVPQLSAFIDTNKENENEDKVSSDSKVSPSESTIKIDADSTISDSELTGHQESPATPESPSSPSSSSSSPTNESPRRLTLDERLKQEHGVTIQEDKPLHPTMSQLYKWGYPVQSSQVIQVGNMLEILPQLQSTNSQTSLIEQVTNSSKIIPTISGEMLSASSSNSSGVIGQQQNTVTSTANISLPSNLAFLDSSVDKAIISQALLTLNALNQENMKKFTQIDPQIQDEDLLTPDINMIAREQLKEKRRELKERRRQAREARREKRRLKTLELARREAVAAAARENPEGVAEDSEEALIREAMFETPNLGSPVPDYEVIDEEEEEKEEEARERRLKRNQPVPLPPAADKGILMSPSYRARDDYRLKSVKFADGILPGEGTSPSGGEEIHSPPPPIHSSHSKEKRLRKKRRVRIKMIKQYGAGTDEDYSPPPPPPGDPLFSVKLFPGFDHHYKATASGAAIIYTQPVLLPGMGGVMSLPGVPVDDTPLIENEGVSSPSVTMSPSGPVVPTPVTLKLPSGCDYNAETMQYIYTSSATQSTASTLVDTNLSKNK